MTKTKLDDMREELPGWSVETRRGHILAWLRQNLGGNASEYAREEGLNQSTASAHFRGLEKEGLIFRHGWSSTSEWFVWPGGPS